MSRLAKILFLFSGLSLASFGLVRFILGTWVPFLWVALGLMVFFAGAAFFVDRQFFKAFFTMKTTRHGMNMGALTLLVLLFLVIVNFLSVRKQRAFDFSLNQVNTLSEQSIQLLKGLEEPLVVRFFYQEGVEGNEENRRLFREWIKKYQDQSSQVQLNFVEVNQSPDLAQEYGVDRGSGVVFIDYQGRRNRIESMDEQGITNAMLKVVKASEKVIYFTVGHGERDLEDATEAGGLNALKLMLENNRFKVQTLALAEKSKVPEDADVLVVAGPQHQFMDFEIQAIEDYLARGGSLFLALEAQKSAGFEKLVAKLNLGLENNFVYNVVETALGTAVNQGPVMGATFSQLSAVTKNFGKSQFTVFNQPMSIKRLPYPSASISVDDLVRTSEAAVGFSSNKITGEGARGPFTLVSSARGLLPGMKDKDFIAVVAGDADFMGNRLLYQNLNRDLILNSFAALSRDESQVTITPKEPQITKMHFTEAKFGLFVFGFILPLPVLLLALAAFLWNRRRSA